MNAQEIRDLAHKKFGSIFLPNAKTPTELLMSVPWDIPKDEAISQETFMQWNLELNPKSCIGRLARAAVLVENHFPAARIQAAEVVENFLRNIMIEMIHSQPLEQSMLMELLWYEEPHTVLLVNGIQFDPLSTVFGELITHPKIEVFPIWEFIACSRMVSLSQTQSSYEKMLEILDQGEAMCPGVSLTKENRIFPLYQLDRVDEVVKLMKELLQKRIRARTLYVLFGLTEDSLYWDMLNRLYTPGIVDLLKQEEADAKERFGL